MIPIFELVQEMMFVNMCVRFRDNWLRNEVCRPVTPFKHVRTNICAGRSLYTLQGYNNVALWMDLLSKMKEDFTCLYKRDGSILIDARMQGNFEVFVKLKKKTDTNTTYKR